MIARLLFIMAYALVVISHVAHADPRPRFDPFKKPDRLIKSATTPQKTANLFQTKLQLFATLRAGKNSMVNIQGRIVQLGEQVDGYNLVEVNESSAVFTNGEQQVNLSLDAK